ncbi:hypothetical protein SH668x_001129 [Planctomicrobium sp. SH668]|uniref:hypothetical protein n=1 Tax=Planctomicrobium sp. SH668 TaxID=3448126 RepID=UPI003F5BC668
MGQATRILLASELTIHVPLDPISNLPELFRKIAYQARELTAIKIFDSAIAHQVDFLILSGTIADFDSEPRLACFLTEQFKRLHNAGVQIGWAANHFGCLPEWAIDPDHVIKIIQGERTPLRSIRTGRVLSVSTVSLNDPSNIQIRSSASPEIVLASGQGQQFVHAFSTDDSQSTSFKMLPVQHNGMNSFEPTGMLLLELHAEEKLVCKILPTSTVDWREEAIEISPTTTRKSLLQSIAESIRALQRSTSSRIVAVDWKLTGTGPLWNDLLLGSSPESLLDEIRAKNVALDRVWNRSLIWIPAPEQEQEWSHSRAVRIALREAENLSTDDCNAAALQFQSTNVEAAIRAYTPSSFQQSRVRIVKELSDSFTIKT